MAFCLSVKKQYIYSYVILNIKISIVRGTVIYNAHIKFELNQKRRLETGIHQTPYWYTP